MSTLRNAARIAFGRPAPATPPTAQRATEYMGLLGSLTGGLATAGATIELSKGERDFSASAVAYRCVSYIAANLASVDLLVLAGEEPDDNDPIAQLWNTGTPGAAYSARVVKEVMYARAELTGEAFAFIDRGETSSGPARGVHPIYDPVEVLTRKVDTFGLIEEVTGYIVRKGGQRIPLLPAEVLWLRYPHPTERWGALAPWKAALYANETDAYARAWQRGEFRNGARPSMVIGLGQLTEEQHASTVAAYTSKIAGAGNAGKSLLVSSPIPPKVEHLSLTPAEMSYLETRVRSAEEVMLAFGLRKDVLYGESTYENQRAAKTAAWTETLLPKLDVMAGELDRQLIPEPGRSAAWDLSEVDALRESEDAVIKRANELAVSDIALLDEARAMVGLDPLPGGIGQYTISAYRERQRLEAAVEYAPQLTGAELRSAPTRLIRHRGATRTLRLRKALQQRTAYDAMQRAYDRHERIGRRAIDRLAERQMRDVLRKLRDITRDANRDETLQRWATYAATMPATMPLPGAEGQQRITHDIGQRMAADDLLNRPHWTEQTVRALEDFFEGTWSEGGERAATGFGLSWDLFDARVLDAMRDRLTVLAGQITDTTRAIIDAELLHAGVAGGETVDQLADRIRSVFADLSTWRAKTIARTEVVGGMNAAAHRVAVDSGLVVSRTWLATKDARTRPSHQRQDGHTVRGTETVYPNGCRYPGDPAGPASETVACRCVELFDTED